MIENFEIEADDVMIVFREDGVELIVPDRHYTEVDPPPYHTVLGMAIGVKVQEEDFQKEVFDEISKVEPEELH